MRVYTHTHTHTHIHTHTHTHTGAWRHERGASTYAAMWAWETAEDGEEEDDWWAAIARYHGSLIVFFS